MTPIDPWSLLAVWAALLAGLGGTAAASALRERNPAPRRWSRAGSRPLLTLWLVLAAAGCALALGARLGALT